MRQQGRSIGIGALRPAVLGLGRVAGIGLSSVAAAPLTARGHGGHDDEHGSGGTPLWILAIASLALTLIGGVFAGLTIA